MLATTAALVGDLACQKNSYLTTLSTRVVHCEDAPDKNGLYRLLLDDTILFPEGGGQPCDRGTVDGVDILDVRREGVTAVHYATAPLEVGKLVMVKVDFARRLDHMQQHSGQHLLSAVAETQEFNLKTSSWNMGEKRSYIELPKDIEPVSQKILDALESKVNGFIRAALSVTVSKSSERPESLPADYHGEHVRVVEIAGIDKNPCCGTHVTNTAELQVLKLLHTERVKGGMTRIFFLFGERVVSYLHEALAREKKIGEILSTGPETFAEQITRSREAHRRVVKSRDHLLRELAEGWERDALYEEAMRHGHVCHHRQDADMEYLTALQRALVARFAPPASSSSEASDSRARNKSNGKGGKESSATAVPGVIVLCAGDVATGGPILMFGDPDKVARFASELPGLMGDDAHCKGGGRQGRWQGKCSHFKKLDDMRSALRRVGSP